MIIGAHETAKEMLRDLLTIRADRDRYYYGVNELFQLQPDPQTGEGCGQWICFLVPENRW